MVDQSGFVFNMMTSSFLGIPAYLFFIITVWELVWKSMALWRAARNNQLYWFIALLLLNTLGILPILYLYVFSKKSKK